MSTREDALAYVALDRKAIDTPQGKLVAMFGLGAELYVEPRERRQLRLDMLSVQEDYYRRFPSSMDLMRFVSEANPEGTLVVLKKAENPFLAVRQSIGNWPTDRAYTNAIVRRFSHPDYPESENTVTPWLSNILVAPETSDELSYYASCMTVGDEQGRLRFDELRDCVLDWAELLRPAHGSAGFTVIMELGVSIISAAPYAYATLQQYPGLDIQVPVSFIGKTQGVFNRIKCVNWLTILGDAILEELGGISIVRRALEPECTLHSYSGGIIVQAGSTPRLGDAQRGHIPEQYRKVAQFTKPVRFMDYESALFRVFGPMSGREETEKWVKRFD